MRAPAKAPAGVDWKPLESASGRAPFVLAQDTAFRVAGPALRLQEPPAELHLRNVLSVGESPFVLLMTELGATRRMRVEAARLTLRGATSLIRMPAVESKTLGRMQIVATDCVFASEAAGAALVQFQATHLPAEWASSLVVEGEGSLLAAGCEVAGLISVDGKPIPLDCSEVEIEGFTAGRFEFAGADAANDVQCVLRRWEAPRRTSTPPGIDPTRFSPQENPARDDAPASPPKRRASATP